MTAGPVRAVVLVGPRAAGKTTVGRLAAAAIGWSFVDADEAIAAAVGVPAGRFLREAGEAEFRRVEAAVTVPLLQSARDGVLALGGGAVLAPAIRAELRLADVLTVWLSAAPAELAARIAAAREERPPLLPLPLLDEVEALLAARAPLYAEVADVSFDTGARAPVAIAREIAGLALRGGR